ncbi:hypothetical protein ABPG74_007963 [Tetrahymena malaccensis]
MNDNTPKDYQDYQHYLISQQSYSNQSKPLHDQLHSQDRVVENRNISSLDNKKQIQIKDLSNCSWIHIQNISSQGNNSQNPNQFDFLISQVTEVEVGNKNPSNQSNEIYNSYQLIKDSDKKKIFQGNIQQIAQLLFNKYYELGIFIEEGGESYIFYDQTKNFSSQEQLNHEESRIGFTSDVYSLGKTLFQQSKITNKSQFNKTKTIEEIQKYWPIDITFLYIKKIETEEFISIVQEIKQNQEQEQDLVILLEQNSIQENFVNKIDKFIQSYTGLQIYLNNNCLDSQSKVGFNNAQAYLLENFNLINSKVSFSIKTFQDPESFINSMNNRERVTELYLQFVDDKQRVQQLNIFLEKFKNIIKLNLNLSQNAIGNDEVQTIANLLEQCENMTQLNLNFNSNKITQEGLSFLKQAIINSKKLTKLNLSLFLNPITNDGVQEIGNSLIESKNITQLNLDLSSTNITQTGAENLGQSLEKWENISKLTHLTLNFNQNKIGPRGVNKILIALKLCQNIIQLKLNLINCNVSGEVIENLSLENCKNMEQFELNLKNNEISNKGSILIGEQIKSFQKITHLNLILSNNQIDEEGIKSIANAIEQYLNLIQLKLVFFLNKIGNQGAKSIAVAIEKCQTITQLHLDLEQNAIGNDKVQTIANLLEKCENMTQFNLNFNILSSNNITKEGLSCLKQAIINSKKLTKLNLSLFLNRITNKGVQEIGMKQLNSNKKYQSQNILFISYTYITQTGAEYLGKSLEKWEHFSKLTHLTLNFQNCNVSGEEIENLSLENCKNMEQFDLNLKNNKISNKGSILIGNQIKTFFKITHLNLILSLNKIGNQGAKSIAVAIEKCQTITQLHLDLEYFLLWFLIK